MDFRCYCFCDCGIRISWKLCSFVLYVIKCNQYIVNKENRREKNDQRKRNCQVKTMQKLTLVRFVSFHRFVFRLLLLLLRIIIIIVFLFFFIHANSERERFGRFYAICCDELITTMRKQKHKIQPLSGSIFDGTDTINSHPFDTM